jgi:hypothetical protein
VLVLVASCGGDDREREPHRRSRRPDAAPPAAALDAGRPGAQLSPVPDTRAHPDYPTARRAGTEELFVVEEPSRGPHVTRVTMPDRANLSFELKAYCEIGHDTVICTDKPPGAKEPGVRVGSWNGRPLLAEWVRGAHVDQTVVIDRDDAGAPTQLAVLDAFGDIDYVRNYAPGGQRYTSTTLNGGNALDGCGEIELERDAQGRVRGARCLQWSGQPMRDINGVAYTRFTRDAAGFVVTEERLSPGGTPLAGKRDGVHRIVTGRDTLGRPISYRYQGIAGDPVASGDDDGCHGADLVYKKNLLHSWTCLGADLAPAEDEEGVTRRVHGYDAAGCQVALAHQDAAGAAVASASGVASIRYQVEEHCHNVVETCLGLDGALVACGVGEPAEYRKQLDDHGRVVRETYRGPGDIPGVNGSYGVAEMRWEYDELGNEIGMSCHDAGGEPVDCGTTGFHAEESVFDAAGREIEARFYDTERRRTSNLGAFGRRSIYDNYDHAAEIQELDEHGALVDSHGMAVRKLYYDDSHRLFGVVLFDRLGQPARYYSCFIDLTCPEGLEWHAVRIVSSPTGRSEKNLFFDDDGQLIATVDCGEHPCW